MSIEKDFEKGKYQDDHDGLEESEVYYFWE